ncbi:MAG: right-handed parallel beta-helix repeat-containing protein [Chloroflexi bacterium]|nr:right-handed parallel beta-helix repeat-containing protein [Chloroflexota bacterium]
MSNLSKSARVFPRITLCIRLSLGLLSISPAAAFLLGDYVAGPSQAAASIIHVDATTGNDANSGLEGSPFRTLQKALTVVQPGMTIRLATGIYQEENVTVIAGTASAPITIEPEPNARPILDGGSVLSGIRVVHSYYTIRNLEIRNINEGVYLEAVTGVVVENNIIRFVNNEGLRLHNSSTRNAIRNNTISGCGLIGNGEGIYVGTAPEQRFKINGRPDASTYNLISGNEIFDVDEGIDIKEDSSFNTVENNIIHHATDPNSGGINVRADQNYFYGNLSRDNAGAGLRFGGDVTLSPLYGANYHYGVKNVLRNNVVNNNAGHGYKFMNGPQNADTTNRGSANGGLLYYYAAGVQPFVTEAAATVTPSPTATATSTPATRVTIRLGKGWNLVSTPARLANPSVRAVFGGIADKVYHLDASTGGWDYGVAAGAQWTGNLTAVEEGEGYWVNALADGSVSLDVLPRNPAAPPPTYPLVSGWNMIGYTNRDLAPSASVNAYLASLKTGWTSLYRYTPGVGFELAKPGFGFSDLDLGRGYFLYVDAAGVLTP